MTGRIFRRPHSANWHIAYSHRGREYRESCGSPDCREAERLLKHRLAELGADSLGLCRFVGPSADRITMNVLFTQLEADFKLRGIKSLPQTLSHLTAAKKEFGNYRAVEITLALVDSWYQAQIAQNRPAIASLNRIVSMVSQALKLGVARQLLASACVLRKLPEAGNARQGFFEKGDFAAVCQYLPDYLRDFAQFAYLTGWRKSAIASLQWQDVDMQARTILLRPEHDKAGTGQLLALEGELWEIIERRRGERITKASATGQSLQCVPVRSDAENGRAKFSLHVFHRYGFPIGDFRKAWAAACRQAGVSGKLFHDLRRTAARNLRRAGVSETVAMRILGQKTPSIFKRYSITDLDDLRQAQTRLQEHLAGQPAERKVLPMP